ncbi:nitrilase/cyanide hydratase and apolipoprotein N-acyltransferase [Natronococcus jeotgali DSM 18795]|uniref:Nitrilase/cyanide hydratase and apolipoprotein N-acyltransferase n=1 Tax=Natronococcus jeotgali DSM 18795 TaxID=1227498 RepID=L9XIK5_9EURY|nr:nitrilase/cyanide hydratase and apolipoprotein N-acyltransferase [Natronococcus jeotgali DSM 18795]
MEDVKNARIASCQFEPNIGDVDANLNQIEQLANQLPTSTVFAVFPELCVTGYDLSDISAAKTPVPGPITEQIQRIAQSAGIDLIVGLPEAAGDDVYNSLVYISNQGVEATYRKQQLWGDEAAQFAAGTEPVVVDTPVGRVGLLLCYDLNFPELALEYDEAGCDHIAVSSAWRQSFDNDWRLLCCARALDQTCYVIGSNHSGTQSGRHHAGESLVAGPRGEIIAKATDDTSTISVEVNVDSIETARIKNPVRKSRHGMTGTSQQ